MDLQYQRPPDAFFSGAASRRSPDGGFFRSDEQLRQVANLHDFAGMLVFDKWTCNTNGRQTLFFQEPPRGGHPTADSSDRTNSCARLRTCMTSPACWSSTNGPAIPTAARRFFFRSRLAAVTRRRILQIGRTVAPGCEPA